MEVSKKSLSFTSEHIPNSLPVSQSVYLTGLSRDNKWKVTGQPSWLMVSPAEGQGDATLDVTVNAKDVPVGDHDINLTISGDMPECRLAVQLRVAIDEQRQRNEVDRQRSESELRSETEAELRKRNEDRLRPRPL